eukprot:CAMPEP_0194047748 /NCGR_PEP_ID=MMETSP0009_2-20130614/25393_1 /TAXON_ID=210454 /ORGANISM="Grammatophora oceanica, Strain CCMP 410" /LENGTH=128 /DNA_ID=CAMNT_0038693443 /DNA_START=103 /DNA_END=489 /DNA_ORIENTATION=+
MTTRSWKCMCGSFEASVTGEPLMACWCHCTLCRQQAGSAMQLGVWKEVDIKSGADNLIEYEAKAGTGTLRKSCKTCGSFCIKVMGNGVSVAPLGCLEPVIKPTMHIFTEDKGGQDIMFPDLDCHDQMP